MCAKLLKSCLTLCDPIAVALQAPLSVVFPRQRYWSGLPLPSPGGLPNLGLKPKSPSPALQVCSGKLYCFVFSLP